MDVIRGGKLLLRGLRARIYALARARASRSCVRAHRVGSQSLSLLLFLFSLAFFFLSFSLPSPSPLLRLQTDSPAAALRKLPPPSPALRSSSLTTLLSGVEPLSIARYEWMYEVD